MHHKNPKKTSSIHPITVTILFFIFPPAAWIIVFLQKKYHTTLTILLALSSILTFLFSFGLAFYFYPKLFSVYKSAALDYPSASIQYLLFYSVMILSTALFGFSIYLFFRLRKKQRLIKTQLILATIAFIFTTLSIPTMAIISIFQPLNKLAKMADKIYIPVPRKTTNVKNWKTYSNTKFGFSIKYPNDVYTNCSNEYFFYMIEGPCGAGETPTEFSIAEIKKGNRATTEIDKSYTTRTEKTTIGNGIEAIKETYSVPKNTKYPSLAFLNSVTRYYVNHNGKTLEIYITKSQYYEEVKERMLSTFKFNNSIPEWKTYTNKKFGFSIKYPDSFYISCSNEDQFYLIKGRCDQGAIHTDFLIKKGSILPTPTPNAYYTATNENTVIGNNIKAIRQIYNIAGKNEKEGSLLGIGTETRYFVSHNNQSLEIFVYRNTEDTEIKNKILSTFKLVQ